MKIQVRPFGKAYGKQAFKYTFITEKGASCTITDLSGAIMSVRVPDKHGVLDNVVLGFDDVKSYVHNAGFLGALIGPVGNRIEGAEFDFEGKHYSFAPNENGTTLLHCVPFGFHTCVWDAECGCDGEKGTLVLTHEFKEEETHWPGNIRAEITYSFTEAAALRIDYRMSSDKETFASPTNHTYFNIAGTSKKSIPSVGRQVIELFADRYTTVDEKCIPTGTAGVCGTPFDLRQGVKLSDGFAHEKEDAQMTIGAGYDHNYILSKPIDLTGLRHAARVTDRLTGRVMNVYTDMPCVQLYTANHLKRYNPAEKRFYGKRRALCLETQCAPDSIHHEGEEGFDVMKFGAGKTFTSSTVYEFQVK